MGLIVMCSEAQEKPSLSIYQDGRLAFLGDDKGNDSGTLNILARLKMQGNQQKWGYLVIFPEFEYADIVGSYKRYSANIGYALNKLIVNRTEATAALGYGWIDRYGYTTCSWSLSGTIAYKLKSHLKLNVLGQFTERTDLLLMYGENELRFSGFVGFEINL